MVFLGSQHSVSPESEQQLVAEGEHLVQGARFTEFRHLKQLLKLALRTLDEVVDEGFVLEVDRVGHRVPLATACLDLVAWAHISNRDAGLGHFIQCDDLVTAVRPTRQSIIHVRKTRKSINLPLLFQCLHDLLDLGDGCRV